MGNACRTCFLAIESRRRPEDRATARGGRRGASRRASRRGRPPRRRRECRGRPPRRQRGGCGGEVPRDGDDWSSELLEPKKGYEEERHNRNDFPAFDPKGENQGHLYCEDGEEACYGREKRRRGLGRKEKPELLGIGPVYEGHDEGEPEGGDEPRRHRRRDRQRHDRVAGLDHVCAPDGKKLQAPASPFTAVIGSEQREHDKEAARITHAARHGDDHGGGVACVPHGGEPADHKRCEQVVRQVFLYDAPVREHQSAHLTSLLL